MNWTPEMHSNVQQLQLGVKELKCYTYLSSDVESLVKAEF